MKIIRMMMKSNSLTPIDCVICAVFVLLMGSAFPSGPVFAQCIDYGDYLHLVGGVDTPASARDDSGRRVASGVYFYQLEAGEFTETKKMTLLK